jgi:hypothetical protein
MTYRLFRFLFVILLFALFPLVASAQTQLGAEPGGIGAIIWGTIQMIAPIVMGSSVVTMFVSSQGGPVKTWIMRIVDFLALAWLKARPDPNAQ